MAFDNWLVTSCWMGIRPVMPMSTPVSFSITLCWLRNAWISEAVPSSVGPPWGVISSCATHPSSLWPMSCACLT